jgi:GNAT superfamily N-acetyltransferase
MAVTVRRLADPDLAPVADLLVGAGLCDRAGLDGRLAGLVASPSGRGLVAEEDGRLVGALLASYNGFHVFLSHIAVAPSHRRRGVGARLHAELAGLARADGARGLIADSRLSAVGFFETLGYRIPGAVFLIRDIPRAPEIAGTED